MRSLTAREFYAPRNQIPARAQHSLRIRTGWRGGPSIRMFTLMRFLTLVPLLPLLGACASSAPVGRPPAAEPSIRQPTLEARTVRATSNPILSDGADYTSDPAPLVVDGKLYILTGRDTAGPGVNDFKMPEWQMLETANDPMAGR